MNEIIGPESDATPRNAGVKVALCMCPEWSLETPPLALGILAAVLKNAGFANCRSFDINLLSADLCTQEQYERMWNPVGAYLWSNPQSFGSEILPVFRTLWMGVVEELATYDIVAFSVYSSNILASDFLATEIKRLNPDVHIYFGGPYCWTQPNASIAEHSYVALACDIEGEGVILDAVNAYVDGQSYESVVGAYCLVDGVPVHNGPRPAIKDLNSIPPADFEGIDIGRYARFHYTNVPHIPLEGSRGCVAKCTFCSETRVFRFKSGDKIRAEMLHAREKYGTSHFAFVDSLVNGSMREFERLVDGLVRDVAEGRMPSTLQLGGYARTHPGMTDDLMERAARAGFKWFSVGVETGTQKILEVMEKRQDLQDTVQMWEACTKHGIRMDTNWITGFPKENQIDWIISLAFLFNHRRHVPAVSANQYPANVLPGTPLFVYRDKFAIQQEGNALCDWVSTDIKSTLINRMLRLKLTHAFLDMWRIWYTGFWNVRQCYELEVRDPASVMTREVIDFWPVSPGPNGTYWTQPHLPPVVPRELDYNVRYLEFANIPSHYHFDPRLSPAETVKQETRHEIQAWCWLIHQLIGACSLRFEIRENYAEQNIEDADFLCAFQFESEADGTYRLAIQNSLTMGPHARRWTQLEYPRQLRHEFMDPAEYESLARQIARNHEARGGRACEGDDWLLLQHDLSFEDNFVAQGNLNEAYENPRYLEETYGTPGYLDAQEKARYKLNLKRTPLTGRY